MTTNYKHLALVWLMLLLAVPGFSQKLDMEMFKNMKPRSIGPAGMSGRVTAIDAVHAEPDIIYVGTASGGLWKTESGGITWISLFDTQAVHSIGAIAINQQNPDEIWVGTGEGNPRNSQSSGQGVYKSIDGGKTWSFMGLGDTRNIHRIFVHRDNPDVVYVGAIGSAWGDTPRGVFMTTDGGKTWENVLFVDQRTGVADMVVDPTNPNKMVVAMWEYRRDPWFFKSGGPGSGLYITHDGGKTWKKKTDKDGLPKGELGRMGLAISKSNPNRLYALIESKKTAMYRSDDGGVKWMKVADRNIGDRPFYYADIAVDPSNENRLYNVFSNVSVSEDGGKTYKILLGWDRVHGDHHFWWIHPDDPDYMINGNDGGMAITRDKGKSWHFVENLPVSQFYHISVDNEIPYNVLGGMQDNGSWRGPNTVWRNGGIRNGYWEEVAFGDGFDVLPDPDDSRYLYAMWQGGNLLHVDIETGGSRYIRPVHPDGTYLRYNWNAPIAPDPFDKKTIYYGSQFVHKSTDKGESWEIISPDLTTNDPEKQKQFESGGLTYDVTNAENHTTLVAIAPSSLKREVIWAGSDDGRIHVTQDGGKTWQDVGGKIKDMPQGSWVPQIHASKYNEGEAYVVVNNYRRNDWTPFLFRTRNYGKTWERLVDENDVWGYALSFVQDPVEKNLMFLGTEFGLYFSIDEGATWNKWKAGYPTASTIDMVIHPREHDLVIGTFGRAAFVLDDIRPLREIAAKGVQVLEDSLVAFPAPDAYLATYKQATGTRFSADAIFKGQVRPYGALVSFYLKGIRKPQPKKDQKPEDVVAPKSDTVKVQVMNAKGEVIRNLKVKAEAGINRFSWSLNRKGVRFPNTPKPKPNAAEPGGPQVMPGTYTVKIKYGELEATTTVEVKQDPRLNISEADLTAKNELYNKLATNVMVATAGMDRIREAQKTVGLVNKILADREDDTAKSLKEMGKVMKDSLQSITHLFVPKKGIQGIFQNPELINQLLGQTFFHVQAVPGKPGQTQQIEVDQTIQALKPVIAKINDFFDQEWPKYKQAVESAELSLFKAYEKLEVKE
ncbi:MAG: VPS10 domain-containing protein [Flammeovirgaceae bacterium]